MLGGRRWWNPPQASCGSPGDVCDLSTLICLACGHSSTLRGLPEHLMHQSLTLVPFSCLLTVIYREAWGQL